MNSETLLKAKIQFAEDEDCVKLYTGDRKLPTGYSASSMICAGDRISGNDTCLVSNSYEIVCWSYLQ